VDSVRVLHELFVLPWYAASLFVRIMYIAGSANKSAYGFAVWCFLHGR